MTEKQRPLEDVDETSDAKPGDTIMDWDRGVVYTVGGEDKLDERIRRLNDENLSEAAKRFLRRP